MHALLLMLLAGCGATYDKGPDVYGDDTGAADTDTDTDADTDADTDSDTDTDTDADTDTGPTFEDAVGTCLSADDLTGATAITVTTLYDDVMPYPDADWDTIPAVSVISEAAAWTDFQTTAGLSLGDVDFTANRVAVATDWRTSTCSMTTLGVDAWAMPDGTTSYVETHLRTDGSDGCDTACSALGSRMVVVVVPASGGVVACRRTETWCGS